MIETTAAVMDVTFYGENANVMVKAKDGFNETITNIFAKSNDQFALAT